MNVTTALQLFVRDSINPLKLADQTISKEEFSKWKSFLIGETATIKLNIQTLNTVQRYKEVREIQTLVSQAGLLSNTVSRYMTKYLPVWEKHAQAHEIKVHYLLTCTAIEDLLTAIYELYPANAAKAKVTLFALPQVKMEIRQSLFRLCLNFKAAPVDPELEDLVLTGISQLINKKNLVNSDRSYLVNLLEKLLNLTTADKQTTIEILILNNFNLPEFFLYCVNNWQRAMAEIPGLHEQKEMLLREKNKLYDLQLNKARAAPGTSELYKDLDHFLSEKYAFVKELVKLRRAAVKDLAAAKAGARYQINLPVPQFGLFIRMQIERGLLVKENIGELFGFFATHFYTANAPFISAESLQKKSTDVEFSTAQKMKGHLIGMLNWLNANYNLSNYN